MKCIKILSHTALVISLLLAIQFSFAQSPEASDPLYEQKRDVPPNPFIDHHQFFPHIHITDKSLFTLYEAKPLPLTQSEKLDGIKKVRLGTIQLAKGTVAYFDAIVHPMGVDYELKHLKTGRLIHTISQSDKSSPVLFTGNGVLYTRELLQTMCWGHVTHKYELIHDKFIEVKQAMYLVDDVSNVVQDTKLYLEPNKNSPLVANLQKGMVVKVLTKQGNDRFLVKTPLGLTGWLIDDGVSSSLLIRLCN